MRGTIQESERTELDQEGAGSYSALDQEGADPNPAACRKRNARRWYAAGFLLILACVLLVCWANGTWSKEEQSDPDLLGDTDGVSIQSEASPDPAVTPPSADGAAFVQTDSDPEEEQEPELLPENEDPKPSDETQESEPPAETRAPEPPAESQEPEAPAQQSEDPAQGDRETPAEAEETPPPPTIQEKLDEQVQKVLDKIITDGMTKLEQAKAVWSFTKGGISYTGSSEKSDWISGAYEGLTTRRGDCFTYYAVSRALLTALGIDNLEVQRVGGVTSHYWNLVNCGDGWYHFDATPRSSKLPYFVSFMFTDEEAADYTARVGGGREYYAFDGSLYPARGTGDPAAELSG